MAGAAHLASQQSRIRLVRADLDATANVMGEHNYDVALCCGVLMYVSEDTAASAIRTMLERATVIGLICLAHEQGAAPPGPSSARAVDGAYTHDVHSMIQSAGGRVVSSQWIGTAASGSSPSHVIVAERRMDADPVFAAG